MNIIKLESYELTFIEVAKDIDIFFEGGGGDIFVILTTKLRSY